MITALRPESENDMAKFIDITGSPVTFYIGPAEANEKEYKRLLNTGRTLQKDGDTQWIEFHEILDNDGREIHNNGRVKGSRILVTLHNATKPSSERYQTRKALGTSWRKIR